MIEIIVNLKSSRGPQFNRLLGKATITNDGTGNAEISNYEIRLSKWEPKSNQTWLKGRLEGFNRRRRGSWDLLYLCLRQLLSGRNPQVNTEKLTFEELQFED